MGGFLAFKAELLEVALTVGQGREPLLGVGQLGGELVNAGLLDFGYLCAIGLVAVLDSSIAVGDGVTSLSFEVGDGLGLVKISSRTSK